MTKTADKVSLSVVEEWKAVSKQVQFIKDRVACARVCYDPVVLDAMKRTSVSREVWRGLGGLLGAGVHVHRARRIVRSDAEAILSDWARLGADLRTVMVRVETELDRDQRWVKAGSVRSGVTVRGKKPYPTKAVAKG